MQNKLPCRATGSVPLIANAPLFNRANAKSCMIYCQSTTNDHSYNWLQINALLGQAMKLSRATLRNNNTSERVISMFSVLNANGNNAFESNWFYWNASLPFEKDPWGAFLICGAHSKTPVSTNLLSSNVFYLREHSHQSMPIFAFNAKSGPKYFLLCRGFILKTIRHSR